MSPDDITPDTTRDAPMREVTVSVPEHRVEQFRRFHARFLEMAAHWDAQVGNEDVRGPRGRRGRRGPGGRHHGPRHGRCGHRHDASAETTDAAA